MFILVTSSYVHMVKETACTVNPAGRFTYCRLCARDLMWWSSNILTFIACSTLSYNAPDNIVDDDYELVTVPRKLSAYLFTLYAAIWYADTCMVHGYQLNASVHVSLQTFLCVTFICRSNCSLCDIGQRAAKTPRREISLLLVDMRGCLKYEWVRMGELCEIV